MRTQGSLFQFVHRPLVVVYYNVDYVKDPKGSNYWRNRVLKVAQEYKRKVYFAVSNKDDFAQVASDCVIPNSIKNPFTLAACLQEVEQSGLADRKDSDKPIVAMITKDGKFPMNKEFRYETPDSYGELKAFWKFLCRLRSFPS